jgi:hypothetical protein
MTPRGRLHSLLLQWSISLTLLPWPCSWGLRLEGIDIHLVLSQSQGPKDCHIWMNPAYFSFSISRLTCLNTGHLPWVLMNPGYFELKTEHLQNWLTGLPNIPSHPLIVLLTSCFAISLASMHRHSLYFLLLYQNIWGSLMHNEKRFI